MGMRDLLFLGVVLGGAGALGAGLLRPPGSVPSRPAKGAESREHARDAFRPVVARVDASFRLGWTERGLDPAPPALDLAIMRRLALALTGSVPSLEEIRRFEARPAEGRNEAWLDDLLRDRRTSDYLAERFARAFVGTEDGPFLVFRRRRFISWLSDAILEGRRYDAIVRDLIADRGLWTDHPATNFLTVTRDEMTERPDPERVAARVARAFLGVRLDCAQCHDHPFQPWKQDDFRGLAAFFGGVHSNLRGVNDGEGTFQPLDLKTQKPVTVLPHVPFRPELKPGTGTPREQLAAWVIDPRNPNLARATVNRVWAVLFGRPIVDPVDDLPTTGDLPPALELLAADFSAHGYDLHRLIRIIVATEAFRLDSTGTPEGPTEAHDEAWAAFPMTRLRPEQVAGAILQASSLSTRDAQSHWFVRLIAYTGRNDFVRRFGDTGEDEFDARGGTIPQRLLLMNGELVQKQTEGFLNAAPQIAQLAPGDRKAVEVAYLAVMTRRPTPEESAHFAARLEGTSGKERKARLTDLYWTLLNATEFSWNH